MLWFSISVVLTLTTILGTLGLLFKRRQNSRKVSRLHKLQWLKDKVYLVQFPVSPKIRSISPFSIKLETWLRLNNIPYENVYSLKFSKKGQIPYIEMNGHQIADSNIIISRLKDHFKVDPDENVAAGKKAVAHAISIMVENHTAVAGFNWRYGHHMGEFFEKLILHYGTGISMFFFRYVQPAAIRFRTHLHGLGRHSLEEINEFTYKDLDAISNILGENDFFLGTEKPTTIDCTLFGHLVQFLYIPMNFPQKQFVKENCPNILRYLDRMRDAVWPDWEEQCQKGCMEGKMGYDLQSSQD